MSKKREARPQPGIRYGGLRKNKEWVRLLEATKTRVNGKRVFPTFQTGKNWNELCCEAVSFLLLCQSPKQAFWSSGMLWRGLQPWAVR